ncbi:MAG: hypothetical protein ACK5PB_14865 [Pirellula sp.]
MADATALIMNSTQSKRAKHALIGFIPRSAILSLALGICTGCQQFPWPGSPQAKQFQVDSERILGEFRAQKKRADELAARNQQLEARLAETEKSLARQNLQSLSQSNSSSSRNNRKNTATSTPSKSQLNVSPPDDDPGLPDVPPSMAGLLTSGGGFSRIGGAVDNQSDQKGSPQWRPVRRK